MHKKKVLKIWTDCRPRKRRPWKRCLCTNWEASYVYTQWNKKQLNKPKTIIGTGSSLSPTRNFQDGGRVADFQLSSPLIESAAFVYRKSSTKWDTVPLTLLMPCTWWKVFFFFSQMLSIPFNPYTWDSTKHRVNSDVLALDLKDDTRKLIKVSNLSNNAIIVTSLWLEQPFPFENGQYYPQIYVVKY